jgi:uncharacterized protein (UPF0305 family)
MRIEIIKLGQERRIQKPNNIKMIEEIADEQIIIRIYDWLTLDLWLAKDNRFLNPKSSYKRILRNQWKETLPSWLNRLIP